MTARAAAAVVPVLPAITGSSCWKLMSHMDELISGEAVKGERMDMALVEWATAVRKAASERGAQADWEVCKRGERTKGAA